MSNKLFAISDLHLSGARPKPMDIFGSNWTGHQEKTAQAWRAAVGPQDVVLLAGDTSWAMDEAQAQPDLEFLAELPGTKVLIKGNHDYWWKAISKLRRAWAGRLEFIQNDALRLPGLIIGGSRLWSYPFVTWGSTPIGAHAEPTPEDEKIAAREIDRLKLSLKAMGPPDGSFRAVMTHFPPLSQDAAPNQITDLLTENRIDLCVFGHLHDLDRSKIPDFDHRLNGVRYVLTSCDFLDFKPLPVGEF